MEERKQAALARRQEQQERMKKEREMHSVAAQSFNLFERPEKVRKRERERVRHWVRVANFSGIKSARFQEKTWHLSSNSQISK